jgi:hypothetical protein
MAPAAQPRAAGGHAARGYYVYGIVPADVEAVSGATGVGDPPAELQVIRHNRVAALVSEIDLGQPLGRSDDLRAHQELLDAASAEAPVLPLRFGAVMTGAQAVTDELLAPHEEAFAAALSQLEGHAQYVIKGRYAERAVLTEILKANAEAARLLGHIRQTASDAATREERIRLGELIGDAIAAKRAADTRELGDTLAGYVIASSIREPTHEMDAVHVAVLAETAGAHRLEEAVDRLADDWQDRITLRLLGPMAAYDFVTTPAPQG